MSHIKEEILPVTTLRFVAAFYVFLFHWDIHWPLASEGTFGDRFLSQGAVGMSLFFILSGFVLSARYANAQLSLKSYYYSRFTRIYPIYFLAGIVTLPWLFSTLSSLQGTPISQHIGALFLIITNVFLIQAWFPQTFDFWNNGASWSISVEAFFYVLFPFVLATPAKTIKKYWTFLFCIMLTLAALPGLSLLVFSDGSPVRTFYSVPVFRVAEFIVGVLLGVRYLDGSRLKYPSFWLLGAITSLVVFLGFAQLRPWTFVSANFFAVPALALIIFASASLNSGALHAIMSQRIFVKLGHISYSFYSFQALVLLWLLDNHAGLLVVHPILANNWILAAVSFCCLSLIAWIMFELVEVRFRKILERNKPEPFQR